MDEANRNLDIYDSAKNSQNLMKTVHDWLQQTRKHKLTLWFFVQDVAWIKSQVLALCDRLWRAKRVRVKGTQMIKYFPWYGGDPFSKGKGSTLSRGVDFKMRFDFDLWTARCYNTLQAVRTLEPSTSFNSFGEISDYMYAHGMKPLELDKKSDYYTMKEEHNVFWQFVLVDLAAIYKDRHDVSPPAPAPDGRTGWGWGGRDGDDYGAGGLLLT